MAEAAIRWWWASTTIPNRAANQTVTLTYGRAGTPGPTATTVAVTVVNDVSSKRVSATVTLQSMNDDPQKPGSKISVLRTVEAGYNTCNNIEACSSPAAPAYTVWAP
jgi:hypothetical protein